MSPPLCPLHLTETDSAPYRPQASAPETSPTRNTGKKYQAGSKHLAAMAPLADSRICVASDGVRRAIA
jgi:hypothetical protein